MEHERQQCPLCGNPVSRHTAREPTASPIARRPTEDECWRAFWQHMAAIWADLPSEVQRECLDKVAERKSTVAKT